MGSEESAREEVGRDGNDDVAVLCWTVVHQTSTRSSSIFEPNSTVISST